MSHPGRYPVLPVQLSNVVIQGAVNSYGSTIIAAVGAASSIEGFIYIAMNSFHQAAQTFISQNLGAGKYDRIGRVLRICLMSTLVIGVSLSALTVLLAHPLIGIYNGDPAVIQAGAERLYIVASVYVIFGIADVFVGAIRGCGVPIVPVIINLLGTCAFRLLWIAWLDTSWVWGGMGLYLLSDQLDADPDRTRAVLVPPAA